MTADDLALAAADAAGADAVRAPAGEADRVDGVVPQIVVTPRTPEAVATTLAWANRERLSVVLSGAGTKLAWGRPPAQVDVALRLRALDRIIEHAHGDLTATIEAGAVLGDVNAVLGRHGQYLPLDPMHDAGATIGGLLATNDSGPLRCRYGTPADLVLGVAVATTDGRLAKAGGRVVKNVAGYDLGRLLAGSHGSLAAIVSATFKLAPLPAATATAVIIADAAVLADVVAALTDHQLEPLAIEIQAESGPSGPRHALLVRFASDGATVAAAMAATRTIGQSMGASIDEIAGSGEHDWWETHRSFPWLAPTVVRLSWLPANLAPALRQLEALAGSVRWRLSGRAGVGAGHLGINGSVEEQRVFIGALRRTTVFGHVTIVTGPQALRASVDVWDTATAPTGIWKALKESWDPVGILGAGRGPL